MKLTSTSASLLYNNMESRHPWWTRNRVEGSDRRPFILIFDSILVYATLIMWMYLSPYFNLCKAERIKLTRRILQKDFHSVYYSVYYSFYYVTNSRKSVYSKITPFLIASDWHLSIIVSNVFCIWFLRISSINVLV